MNIEVAVSSFWNQNDRLITIGAVILFVLLAFTKRKILACLIGILATVLINQAFSQELLSLAYEITYAVNTFLNSHDITQLGQLSVDLMITILRPLPFFIVVLSVWRIKRWFKRIKKRVEKVQGKQEERKNALEAARIKAKAEAEQKRIQDVKSEIANTVSYKLNILPFVTRIGSIGTHTSDYEYFVRRMQDFVLKQERLCKKLDIEAEELKLPERTMMHQK